MAIDPGHIFTLDYVDVVRGREADYMASSHSLVAAHSHSILGDTGVLQLQATEVAGAWPCVVNVWDRSWETWLATVAGRFADTDRNVAIEAWWQANTDVRTGGLDLVLTGSPGTAPLAEAALAVAACPVFVVDTVRLAARDVASFLDGADDVLRREVEAAGGGFVGAYRALWRPNLAVTIVGLASSRSIDTLLAPVLGGGWARRRADTVRDADCRVMLPARSNPGRVTRS